MNDLKVEDVCVGGGGGGCQSGIPIQPFTEKLCLSLSFEGPPFGQEKTHHADPSLSFCRVSTGSH